MKSIYKKELDWDYIIEYHPIIEDYIFELLKHIKIKKVTRNLQLQWKDFEWVIIDEQSNQNMQEYVNNL